VRKLIAVLLAVMVLAAVGSYTGYVLGRHELDLRDQASHDSGGDSGTPYPSGVATRSGRPCPDFTEREVRKRFKSPGNLVQVLYIKTSGSEVWICEDSYGNYFYQGHRMSAAEAGGAAREPFGEGNSLLLPTVEREADGSWVATNSVAGGVTRYRDRARPVEP
jgi:hypothetical protein